MTLFLIAMALLCALAWRINPVSAPDEPMTRPIEYLARSVKNFLFSYVWSAWIRFHRLIKSSNGTSLRSPLSIRQILATMWFGRGLLHS